MSSLDDLLDLLWGDYTSHNPVAKKVQDLLLGEGEVVQHDHIALRTFNHPDIGIQTLGHAFEKFDYQQQDQTYEFDDKKIDAFHWGPPEVSYPKVFISELRVQQFSAEFQEIVSDLIDQVPDELPHRWDFPCAGRPWEVSYEDTERLREESEYAAWLASWGFRANHFTVDVNELDGFGTIEELNEFLKQNGIELNTTGGEVKGSEDVYLKQSSTMANTVQREFTDGTYKVPFCYYEFARRYEMSGGQRFEGFVADNADSIFESTDRPS